jgi:hypothetical protein
MAKKEATPEEIEKNLAAMEYSSKDDIYNKAEKVDDIDPDDKSIIKPINKNPDTLNEKTFEDDLTGDDLDVPGAELDDSNEEIGEEDEENNYYSLGGDNHDNLEEARD